MNLKYASRPVGAPQTVEKDIFFDKIYTNHCRTLFRPPNPGGVLDSFQESRIRGLSRLPPRSALNDCHRQSAPPKTPLNGVWGDAPIGFPGGEDDCARVWRAQQELATLSAIPIAKVTFSTHCDAPSGRVFY